MFEGLRDVDVYKGVWWLGKGYDIGGKKSGYER